MINIVQSLIGPRNVIFLSRCSKRYAGHSKWANIKHDKAIKDAKRSLNFNRLRRLMFVAITEGNSANPLHNYKLAQIIEQAKKAMMPMTSINNLLTSAQTVKTVTKSGLLEIRGPGGCIILAEYACENFAQLKIALNTILRKCSCVMSDSGAKHMFDRKGVVTTDVQGNVETAIEHAIEADADDVVHWEHGDSKEFQFLCEPEVLFKVKTRLMDLNYNIKSADIMYIPHKRVDLSDSDLEIVSTLCEKLEANEDIVKLHDNIA